MCEVLRRLEWLKPLDYHDRVELIEFMKEKAKTLSGKEKERILDIHIQLIKADGVIPQDERFVDLVRTLGAGESTIHRETGKLFCEFLISENGGIVTVDDFLNTRETAIVLDISRRKTRRLAQQKKIPGTIKNGKRHWRFLPDKVLQFKISTH